MSATSFLLPLQTPTLAHVTSVSFKLAQPAREICPHIISNPETHDSLGHPTQNGLHSPLLGTTKDNEMCKTCGLDGLGCPGHWGRIELNTVCYHPMFVGVILTLIRGTCWNCHAFQANRMEIARHVAKLRLLQAGNLAAASQIDTFIGRLSRGVANDSVPDETVNGRHSKKAPNVTHHDDLVDHYTKLLDQHVERCLLQKSNGKINTVHQNNMKQEVCSEALRSLRRNKCANCGYTNASIKREAHWKLFQSNLSRKSQGSNQAKNLKAAELRFDTEITKVLAETLDKTDVVIEDIALNSDSEEEMDQPDDEEPTQTERANELNTETKSGQTYLHPAVVLAHLRLVFEREKALLDLVYGNQDMKNGRLSSYTSSADKFFLEYVPVPPNRFRPIDKMGDKIFEHPQDVVLSSIIRKNNLLVDISDKIAILEKAIDTPKKLISDQRRIMIETSIQLQQSLNAFMDATKAPATRGVVTTGIKQILEKKEGLFRMHMMGKRVNYACRTVISPDPNLETCEIGLPLVFAKKLTFAESVTPHNFKEMREAVINGAKQYPGAECVVMSNGSVQMLAGLDEIERTAIANELLAPEESVDGATGTNCKKVFRHLKDGDYLLLNRQPTLHKPSIMAHRARVMRATSEKTLRMHYANCNTYNADFDGDEMNVHFPQSHAARAEAKEIMITDQQYLKPTDGTPLRGLIQDHVVCGVKLTQKDRFLDREHYLQLVHGALKESSRRVLTVPPCIFKPVPLWTGKQVITTLLLNISKGRLGLNVESKTQVPGKAWGPTAAEEAQVLVHDGDLVTGILDKSQFGAKSFGLVHACYEVWGAESAGILLGALGRLFTRYTQLMGFTCRMDDLLMTGPSDAVRKRLIEESLAAGRLAAIDYADVANYSHDDQTRIIRQTLETTLRDDNMMKRLDAAYKKRAAASQKAIIGTLPGGLHIPFPTNNMQMMTVSGAKGGAVNVSQISACLGQQELEGRRVPVMVSGKSLPSFKAFDTSLRAGGFISGRFLTGIRPQEYFFHCMAGREGLIDTAVKTARSGYLQRCIIKHLEGLKVQYDHTVRDADGSLLQFHYGEDSLDVMKQSYLFDFKFNAMNMEALVQKYKPEAALDAFQSSEVQKITQKYCKKALKYPTEVDPALSVFSPSTNFNVTSEHFANLIKDYVADNPHNKLSKKPKEGSGQVSKAQFLDMMALKFNQCLVDPGEAVGLLAAQGVGEPSTQMTLNTFHFAGHGAKNVTLGIPRLRELVMTAAKDNNTPIMECNVNDGVTEEDLQTFCTQFSSIRLRDILSRTQSTEKVVDHPESISVPRDRVYTVKLELTDKSIYQDKLKLDINVIHKAIGFRFVKIFFTTLNKYLAKRVSRSAIEVKTTGAMAADLAANDDNVNEVPEINNGKPVGAMLDGDQDSQDGSDVDDEDVKAKRKEVSDYAEQTFEDMEAVESDRENSDATASDDEEEAQTESKENFKSLIKGILSTFSMLTDYRIAADGSSCEFDMSYPVEGHKVLMLSLIDQAIDKVVIHEIPRIKLCQKSLPENLNDTQIRINTEGVNFEGIWERPDILDLNTLSSNNIHQMLITYGVEAARATIVSEISKVFGAYGIGVDARHLSLIADYMTFEGGYKPFNRFGINSNPAPLAKMSFETTMKFLSDAAITGDCDTLTHPSSRIVLGQVVEGGTNHFDVYTPITL